MLEQTKEEGRALRLALDIMWQASRRKRASSLKPDLVHDLGVIEEKADELVDLLNAAAGEEA